MKNETLCLNMTFNLNIIHEKNSYKLLFIKISENQKYFYQYLVWPPLFFSTIEIRLFMDKTSLLHKSFEISVLQTKTMAFFNSATVIKAGDCLTVFLMYLY